MVIGNFFRFLGYLAPQRVNVSSSHVSTRNSHRTLNVSSHALGSRDESAVTASGQYTYLFGFEADSDYNDRVNES
jgi:hypothetical protein